jgi:adenine phosphoribosyltransferase
VTGASSVANLIASLTRDVADFPEPGVQFKDLTPLFADRDGMAAVIDALADVARAAGAELVAGIESRGSLIAAATAIRLGTGVLSIRKQGKIPPPVLSEDYVREYGAASMEIPADGLDLRGRNMVLIDDVLATGGTLGAAKRLLERAGATVLCAAVLVELPDLKGRDAIAPLQLHALSRA